MSNLPDYITYLEDLERDPITLRAVEDVTPEIIALAAGLAEACYGLGNDFRIDWERAYDMLESEGWFVEEMGSPVDRKIRREVNKLRKAEGLGTGNTA